MKRFKVVDSFIKFSILILSLTCLTIGFTIKNSGNSSSTYKIPNPEHRKSNLEMLLTLNPAFMINSAKLKSDIGNLKERGVVPHTFEEDDPLPLPNLGQVSTSPPAPIVQAPLQSHSSSSSEKQEILNKVKTGKPVPTLISGSGSGTSSNSNSNSGSGSSSSEVQYSAGSGSGSNTNKNDEDRPRPMTDFQNIKDAYFDLLQQFKEFRKQTSQKISVLEQQLKIHMITSNKTGMMDSMSTKLGDVFDKLVEMDLRNNMTRLMDLCVMKIITDDLGDAVSLWQKLEMSISNPVDHETSKILNEIVMSAYIRNKTNENPVFRFLRKVDDVDKIASYEFLLKEMMKREDFDGSEIFHIAHYLKEHKSVRSTLYSRIPKLVQYAISGRNVNIVFVEGKGQERYYLHVRDDGDRRERHSFYVRASQRYTDSKSAVWRVVYYESSQSFRLRNLLFNDYLIINSEGFLEPTYATHAQAKGTEFDFVLDKNQIKLRSKSYDELDLVSTWAGGRFPYYFSLRTVPGNESKPSATFLIEPDTLI